MHGWRPHASKGILGCRWPGPSGPQDRPSRHGRAHRTLLDRPRLGPRRIRRQAANGKREYPATARPGEWVRPKPSSRRRQDRVWPRLAAPADRTGLDWVGHLLSAQRTRTTGILRSPPESCQETNVTPSACSLQQAQGEPAVAVLVRPFGPVRPERHAPRGARRLPIAPLACTMLQRIGEDAPKGEEGKRARPETVSPPGVARKGPFPDSE